MNQTQQRYERIIVPIANDIVRSGYLNPEDPMKAYYTQPHQIARYKMTIDWDISVVVEVDGWANDEASFRWILNPTSPNVSFGDISAGHLPGDAFGCGLIDARIGFKLNETGGYRYRRSFRRRLDDIDPVKPDSRFTSAPSLLKH